MTTDKHGEFSRKVAIDHYFLPEHPDFVCAVSAISEAVEIALGEAAAEMWEVKQGLMDIRDAKEWSPHNQV